MTDKYAVEIVFRFVSVNDASELRKAIETELGTGLTTLRDSYSVSLGEETGECDLRASLRFPKKESRDKISGAAEKAKAKIKPGSMGRIATHVCKHDVGNRGYGSCEEPIVAEWGSVE